MDQYICSDSTHNRGVDIIAKVSNPLERKSNQTTAFSGSCLHSRGQGKQESGEEKRERETELHSVESLPRAISRIGRCCKGKRTAEGPASGKKNVEKREGGGGCIAMSAWSLYMSRGPCVLNIGRCQGTERIAPSFYGSAINLSGLVMFVS